MIGRDDEYGKQKSNDDNIDIEQALVDYVPVSVRAQKHLAISL
jgi:hypothetical protein